MNITDGSFELVIVPIENQLTNSSTTDYKIIGITTVLYE